MLASINVKINEDRYLLNSLTKACRLVNDHVRVRLPIHRDMLNMIIEQADKYFNDKGQNYLAVLYKAIFAAAYYRLLRVGEIAADSHPILVHDAHIATNKNKILFILRTSKTHTRASFPQSVKITGCKKINSRYCPFLILQNYIKQRKSALTKSEPFFTFQDRLLIPATHIRKVLRICLSRCGFRTDVYSVHSLCIGRASDLCRMGVPVSTIKKLGRWKSNSVYAYLRL